MLVTSSLTFSKVLLAALFATLECVASKVESTVLCKLFPHHLKNYRMNNEGDFHLEERTYQFLLQFNPKSRFQQSGHIFFLLGVVFILACDILTDKGGIRRTVGAGLRKYSQKRIYSSPVPTSASPTPPDGSNLNIIWLHCNCCVKWRHNSRQNECLFDLMDALLYSVL